VIYFVALIAVCVLTWWWPSCSWWVSY